MPISSGALDWPVSYFSKHEEPEVTPDIYDGTKKAKDGQIWTVQLTDRGDFEDWKAKHDKKVIRILYYEHEFHALISHGFRCLR